jgi:hypothetical protein
MREGGIGRKQYESLAGQPLHSQNRLCASCAPHQTRFKTSSPQPLRGGIQRMQTKSSCQALLYAIIEAAPVLLWLPAAITLLTPASASQSHQAQVTSSRCYCCTRCYCYTRTHMHNPATAARLLLRRHAHQEGG